MVDLKDVLDDCILLRDKPYKIGRGNKDNTMKVVVSRISGLNTGDKVYQFRRQDGVVILVPEYIIKSMEA